MIGTGDQGRPPFRAESRTKSANTDSQVLEGTEGLHLRVQQLALRQQMERNHFLLQRLNASSARLIQSLENGDAFEAIAEIIGNLIGSEEVAIFEYCPADETFPLAWSWGVEPAAMQLFKSGAGMFGRAVRLGASQFQERQPEKALLPFEKNLTACVLLKSSHEVVGIIAIFGLLPQKSRLEWADFELLKFLETYATVAIQFQRMQQKQVAP
jgi:hypothetical protein